MDASEMEVLVQRLVANPHDQEALAYAHEAGNEDPKSYAVFLEKVGHASPDPSFASHWLSESANVWSLTLGDAHRAARVLMLAVDKDPTHEAAAERLADLYRAKGEHKALVALLERRAKALAPLAAQEDALRLHLAGVHEELGRLWSEPPLSSTKKAIDNYKRAIELDGGSAYAVYALRELYKQSEQWALALPLFAAEQAVVTEVERKVALYRDEADVRRLAGEREGVTIALRHAHELDRDDPAIVQELGASILERVQAGDRVSAAERKEGAELLVTLAESYDGEHGLAYSQAALDLVPGHDRAMQLAAHYADALGESAALGARWKAYLASNPQGALADEARAATGAVAAADPEPLPTATATASAVTRTEEHILEARRGSDWAAVAHDGDAEDEDVEEVNDDELEAPPAAEELAPVTQAVAPLDEPMAHPTAATDREQSQASIRTAQVMRSLEAGAALAGKNQRPQALVKYREVLSVDPAHPEALAWVEDYLRQKRLYAELRDVLMQAVRSPSASPESRKQQLLEVAGLCETQLRDTDTAIQAWKQICSIDRADTSARDHLRKLLERVGRWDDLATLVEQEAMSAPDLNTKITLEKRLAHLHEGKRKDFLAAGEVWARIAGLLSGDEAPIQNALKLFDKAQRPDLAAQVIAEHTSALDDAPSRAALYLQLAELRENVNQHAEAGEAYLLAAEAESRARTWELAERALTTGEQWSRAAEVSERRAAMARDVEAEAVHYAQAARLYERAGDAASALRCAERASELDPISDALATEVERHYEAAERWQDWATFLLARANRVDDRPKATLLRKRAAAMLQERVGDADAARTAWLRALEGGEDSEALQKLAAEAEQRGALDEARGYLRRLVEHASTPREKLEPALAEAELLAGRLADVPAAVERYLWIADELGHRPALDQVIVLEEGRHNPAGLAVALERVLVVAETESERVDVARKLGELYERDLDNPKSAIRALEIVRSADPEDFDATARLLGLSETVEDWPRAAAMLAALAEVEGDEHELSLLTRKLASILADRMGQPDEALAVLAAQASAGDEPSREAYIELADRAGREGQVAAKLVLWYGHSAPSPKRNQALRGAFDRFVVQGDDEPAAQVGVQLALSKGGDRDLAQQLERIAVRLRDLGALGVAQELLVRDWVGHERALELVRQAEVLCSAGVDPVEAQHHGEAGLVNLPPGEVEPLLARLARLTTIPSLAVDVYERQVIRCKLPSDRVAALGRAAQVAAQHDHLARAKTFYGLALLTPPVEETVTALERSAEEGDRHLDPSSTRVRSTLAEALATGGAGTRDGGRTRSLLLRRAAQIARTALGDVEQAFIWLGDALIAHVDGASLDALEQLANDVGDIRRAEATLGRALGEVFDGPLVRQLLARRIRIRHDILSDKQGAAEDLKKLHDVSPGDVAVMDELSQLLTELGDSRGMVHVLEDQILRGKDVAARAELARKVARLWERELKDPREAADAWRRVLRMKPADPEAQARLERAKAEMLHVRHVPAPKDDIHAADADMSSSDADDDRTDPQGVSAASIDDGSAFDVALESQPPAALEPEPSGPGTEPSQAAHRLAEHEQGAEHELPRADDAEESSPEVPDGTDQPTGETQLAGDGDGLAGDDALADEGDVLAVDDDELLEVGEVTRGSEATPTPASEDSTAVESDDQATRSEEPEHHGRA